MLTLIWYHLNQRLVPYNKNYWYPLLRTVILLKPQNFRTGSPAFSPSSHQCCYIPWEEWPYLSVIQNRFLQVYSDVTWWSNSITIQWSSTFFQSLILACCNIFTCNMINGIFWPCLLLSWNSIYCSRHSCLNIYFSILLFWFYQIPECKCCNVYYKILWCFHSHRYF